ncbi:uncharacterized protein LOC121425621 isoform X2 [Lytechinus variegatus]|uniref:uncharacterized protein LOC121425621 isoform X2 n=1 Tax=Lytechinus variegatus TaxID=7654 RepID=UPI001BB1E099|nr:uncharacterized protein LOC121425621 isoform X2 [Lytechinus variegatus]
MINYWSKIIISFLMMYHHLRLSHESPVHKRLIDSLPACKVYGIFHIVGSSEIPRCDLHTSCSKHSDCPIPGFECGCNPQCGMVCSCPPARGDEPSVKVGGLVSMTRCSDKRACSRDSDCTELSTKGVTYECVCSERCGQVCHGTPTVPYTRAGRCPRPTFIYDFVFCRLRMDCMHDAHCLDNENMKCCQSTCGMKCMLAVSDIDSMSATPSTMMTTTMTSSTLNGSMGSMARSDNESRMDFENKTEMSTEVTSDFMTTLEPVMNDDEDDDGDGRNTGNSNKQRSSREAGRCRTGLRLRNKPGGGHRRCNSNHPCYDNGYHPLCGSDGLSYASECYLRREQERLGIQIAVRHRGYCFVEGGRRVAAESDNSKRNSKRQSCKSCGINPSYGSDGIHERPDEVGNALKGYLSERQRFLDG